jgi:hypothetical protein
MYCDVLHYYIILFLKADKNNYQGILIIILPLTCQAQFHCQVLVPLALPKILATFLKLVKLIDKVDISFSHLPGAGPLPGARSTCSALNKRYLNIYINT